MSSHQRGFVFGGATMTTKSTFEHVLDKHSSSICADFRKKQLEVIADAGKIRFNGFWVDIAALKCDVVAKGFGCRVNGHVM
jgi:hypothetical protein